MAWSTMIQRTIFFNIRLLIIGEYCLNYALNALFGVWLWNLRMDIQNSAVSIWCFPRLVKCGHSHRVRDSLLIERMQIYLSSSSVNVDAIDKKYIFEQIYKLAVSKSAASMQNTNNGSFIRTSWCQLVFFWQLTLVEHLKGFLANNTENTGNTIVKRVRVFPHV